MGASPGLVDFGVLNERLSRLRLSAHAQVSDYSGGRDSPAFSAGSPGITPPPAAAAAALAAVLLSRWLRSPDPARRYCGPDQPLYRR